MHVYTHTRTYNAVESAGNFCSASYRAQDWHCSVFARASTSSILVAARPMDCTREDVLAEAVLLLAAVANLPNFEARRCLRPSGNLELKIVLSCSLLRRVTRRASLCARFSFHAVCVCLSPIRSRLYGLTCWTTSTSAF